MEKVINLQIEKLPEGYYLATSKDVQGLIAQGKTLEETIAIAKDVAEKIIEARRGNIVALNSIKNSFNYPLVVNV